MRPGTGLGGEGGWWRSEASLLAFLAYLRLCQTWLVGFKGMPSGDGDWDNRIGVDRGREDLGDLLEKCGERADHNR